MPLTHFRSAAVVLALAACVSGWGCAGGEGFHPTLGKPREGSIITVRQPEGHRFDIIVHIVNSDPELWQREKRLESVLRHLKGQCRNPQVEDLYVHDMGYWPDGGKKVSFTMGVSCEKPPE